MPGQAPKLEIIRAGAGAGKTHTLIKTLVKRIKEHHTANSGAFPRTVVSTFTRKATRELKERIIKEALKLNQPDFIQYVGYSPFFQISTLHGIFSNFLQTHCDKIDFSPGAKIISAHSADKLFISILKDLMFKQKTGTALLDHYSFEEIASLLKIYTAHIQYCPSSAPPDREQMRTAIAKTEQELMKEQQQREAEGKIKPTQTLQDNINALQEEKQLLPLFINFSSQVREIGQKLLPLWTQKKRELSQITMNDLETMTLTILNQKTFIEEGTKDFWFVDEYQDISPIQKQILDKLSQKSRRVFIVGDPQQSIYYFRGADASVFLQTEEEGKTAGRAEPLKYLETNYRSTPELTAFFNDFFPTEKNFKKIKSPTPPTNKQKEVARFILTDPFADDQEEQQLKAVANRIDILIKNGAKPEEIAVLGARNKALFKTAQYLKRKNFPIHLHSAGAFQERREVIDALSILQFLLNPHDNKNLIGLLRTPYCRVPDQTIVQWIAEKTDKEKADVEKANTEVADAETSKPAVTNGPKQIKKKQSLWNFLLTKDLPAEEGYAVRALKSYLTNTHNIGITHSFQSALEDLQFFNLSYYQDPTGVREANLWKLIYCLKEHEHRGNISSFVDDLLHQALKTETEDTGHSQNAVSARESSGVQLMTIHGAKGLEFKHLILIKVSDGFYQGQPFPYFTGDKKNRQWAVSIRSKKEDKRIRSSFHKSLQEEQKQLEIEEFDRLLYVALTRAKETVTLVLSKKKSNSWHARFPFFKTLSEGHHQQQNYAYLVEVPSFAPSKTDKV